MSPLAVLREVWLPNLEWENREWLVKVSVSALQREAGERLFQFVNTACLTGGMFSPGCGKFYSRVNKKQSTQRKVLHFKGW